MITRCECHCDGIAARCIARVKHDIDPEEVSYEAKSGEDRRTHHHTSTQKIQRK